MYFALFGFYLSSPFYVYFIGYKLKVEGMSTRTTEDQVRDYFSNIRRSCGGQIEESIYDETLDCFVITFTDNAGEISLLILLRLTL